MSNNQLAENIMERLERVGSRLEKLFAIQTLQEEGGLSEPLNLLERDFSEDPLRAPSDNHDGQEPCGPSAPPKNPLTSRAAISARKMVSILQKLEKINQDAAILERVEKLERQNRKITILGSMFMTLTVLMLGAFGYLMVQGNLSNKEVFLHAEQKVDFPKSPSGETTAKVNGPHLPAPVIANQDPGAAESVLKVSDPQPVATPNGPKAVEAAAPVKYVGSMTSNKYHYPDCKWAKEILPRKLLHFPSSAEARKQGYIPCPTCHPSDYD